MTRLSLPPRAGRVVAAIVATACVWIFSVPAPADAGQVRLAQAEIGEAEFWARAKDSNDRTLLEMYLRVFPTGAHVEDAKARLKELPAAGEEVPKEYTAGEKGWFGVEIRAVELTAEQSQLSSYKNGLVIVSLVSYGPARKAGLREGDIIVAQDGAEAGPIRPFVEKIANMGAGTQIRISVIRGSELVELPVTLGGRFTDSLDEANAGNAEAQLQVGYAYATGSGVEKDPIKGFDWYMKAANQGNVHALHNVGNAYFYGRGVPKDQAAAIPWYYTAAKMGHASAQTHTAYAYANGIGVPRSDELAVEWYRKAVDQNEPYAMNNLALLYDEGRGGLQKSREQAVELLRRAAALGNELAIENLKRWRLPPYDPFALQRALTDLGLDPGPIDGKPGRKTREAVRAAQRELGRKPDGEASIELLKTLQEAVGKGGLKAVAK